MLEKEIIAILIWNDTELNTLSNQYRLNLKHCQTNVHFGLILDKVWAQWKSDAFLQIFYLKITSCPNDFTQIYYQNNHHIFLHRVTNKLAWNILWAKSASCAPLSFNNNKEKINSSINIMQYFVQRFRQDYFHNY